MISRTRALRLAQTVHTHATSSRQLQLSSQRRPLSSSQPTRAQQQVPIIPGQQDKIDTSAVQRTEKGAVDLPSHELDYNAEVDYRTSAFSPVPYRVVDGSEPGLSVPAAVVSGAPVDLQARVVRIYKPAKPATQSGTWHGLPWLMDWDPLPKGHRWENPLMGWQSTGDFMQGERIGFKSREDAVSFAEKQGYEYYVQEPNVRKFVPKAYANNFTHVPGKLKIVRTK